MLNQLKTLLDSYDEEKELCCVDNSCCKEGENKVSIPVLDFDNIAKKFFVKFGIQAFRSMDALYLSCEKHTLYLMEMKRYPGTINCKDFIEQHFFTYINEGDVILKKNNGECTTKIIDTIFILLCIIGCSDLGEDFYKYFMNRSKLKIAPILVTDFDNETFVGVAQANLDKIDISITKRIEGQVEIINCLNLPRLLN